MSLEAEAGYIASRDECDGAVGLQLQLAIGGDATGGTCDGVVAVFGGDGVAVQQGGLAPALHEGKQGACCKPLGVVMLEGVEEGSKDAAAVAWFSTGDAQGGGGVVQFWRQLLLRGVDVQSKPEHGLFRGIADGGHGAEDTAEFAALKPDVIGPFDGDGQLGKKRQEGTLH